MVTRMRFGVGLLLTLILAGTACQGESTDRPDEKKPKLPSIAFANADGVQVRDGGGSVRKIAAVPAGSEVEALRWSANGKELAWLSVDAKTSDAFVHRAAVPAGPDRKWKCEFLCGDLAFRGADLLGDGALGGTLDSYPADGGKPGSVGVNGLPGDGGLSLLPPSVSLLAATGRPDGLFVTSAATGKPRGVYRVGADGTATLVYDTGSPESVLNGVISADGRSLAYTTARAGGSCALTETVTVVDLTTKKATKVAAPESTKPWFASAVWFDARGNVVVAYVEGPVACATAAGSKAAPQQLTATVYRRDGDRWVATSTRARNGADLGAGRTAYLTGPLTVGAERIQRSASGTLVLAGDGADRTLATGVTDFAVAPAG